MTYIGIRSRNIIGLRVLVWAVDDMLACEAHLLVGNESTLTACRKLKSVGQNFLKVLVSVSFPVLKSLQAHTKQITELCLCKLLLCSVFGEQRWKFRWRVRIDPYSS
jgi:hypothetical protein